eukprot:3261299-Pleurochrysis_carterae.AAC.1
MSRSRRSMCSPCSPSHTRRRSGFCAQLSARVSDRKLRIASFGSHASAAGRTRYQSKMAADAENATSQQVLNRRKQR